MTENERKFLGLFGLCVKSGNVQYGAYGCMSAIKKRKIKLLIIDASASENTKKEFADKCLYNNIRYIIWDKEPIGRIAGKPKHKLFGIKCQNFANKLAEYYDNDMPGVLF